MTRKDRDQARTSSALLLTQLGRRATRRFRSALTPSGLSPRQAALLIELRDRGPMTQQALAEALDIDTTNLVALLNDVEGEGLAVRRRDAGDRRRHIVELSDRGAARLAQADRALVAVEERTLRGLAAEERSQLQRLLARIARGDGSYVRSPG